MQNSVGQYQTQPMQQAQPACVPQPPASAIPGTQSGVYIQIFNPSVGAPGAAPVYNVNAPAYGTNPNQAQCYPSNYYTTNWGQGYSNPQYPAANIPGQSINGGVTQNQNVTVNPAAYPAVNMPQQTQSKTVPQAGKSTKQIQSSSTATETTSG